MTNLNTLKNWFKTGLKPTQEQFWEWMDSFFHKEEKIPMAQIEGIEETLQNKADAEQLQHKANTDASGLNEEHVISWKKTLGVGELPTNIATIDEEDKTGNVHTKEQITDLLKNSGKNLGNSDLVIPTGEVRTLDATGAKLLIKGLENKKNEAGFKYRLKANERGELGVSDEVDLSVNIPEEFKGTGSVNSTTITVNHIYPQDPPQKTEFTEKLKEVMKQYKTIDFTPLNNGWDIWTEQNEGLDKNKFDPNGWVYFNLDASDKWNNISTNVVKITNQLLLPNDKNWIVDIKVQGSFGNYALGVGREENVEYGGGTTASIWGKSYLILNNGGNSNKRSEAQYLIIKLDNIITTVMYCGDECKFSSQNGNSELGDYKVMFSGKKENVTGRFKAKYKILN